MDFVDYQYFADNISSINLEICWQEDDRVGDAEWRWGQWDVMELLDDETFEKYDA